MSNWTEIDVTWREFQSDENCHPGTLIEVDGKIYLIGDINNLGGVCDDCMDFKYESKVTKYKIVVEKDW